MNVQAARDIEEYLKPTEFCDFKNPEIIAKAEELTKETNTPQKAALLIFYFVRDKIIFMMGKGSKASGTLKRGYGQCGGKTNLQVALLRALKIPAGYHFVSVYKECLKGIISESAYKTLPDIITHHCWCECYLSERWISCETLFDKALVAGIYKKGIYTKEQLPTIDWDGKKDLIIATPWMIEDKGILDSIDDIFLASRKEFEKIPTELMNSLISETNKYIASLRNP